jgi:hypothetical protein
LAAGSVRPFREAAVVYQNSATAEGADQMYAAVEEIPGSSFAGSVDESLMAYYHASFDESGKFRDSKHVVFAGCLADPQNWDGLNKKWMQRLRAAGLSSFHMAKAMSLQDEFIRWTGARRDQLVEDLTEIVRNHILAFFSTGIEVAHFKAAQGEFKRRYKDPHYLAVHETMLLTLRYLSMPSDRLSVVFDDDTQYAMDCYRIFQKLKLRNPAAKKRIMSICFADDESYFPLQAADMWAWLNRDELVRQTHFPDRPTNPVYARIVSICHADLRPAFYRSNDDGVGFEGLIEE